MLVNTKLVSLVQLGVLPLRFPLGRVTCIWTAAETFPTVVLVHGRATPKRSAVTASDPALGFTASAHRVALQVLLVHHHHHHLNFPRLDHLALQADLKVWNRCRLSCHGTGAY
jgi:hypothetical protein